MVYDRWVQSGQPTCEEALGGGLLDSQPSCVAWWVVRGNKKCPFGFLGFFGLFVVWWVSFFGFFGVPWFLVVWSVFLGFRLALSWFGGSCPVPKS